MQVFEPTVKSLLTNVEILLSGKYDEAEEIQIRFVTFSNHETLTLVGKISGLAIQF